MVKSKITYELRPQVPDSCSVVPSNFTYKTNSKIKLLKSSRWRPQRVKLEARGPSEQKAPCICTGCMLTKLEPRLPLWNSKPSLLFGPSASVPVLREEVWFKRCLSWDCKLKARTQSADSCAFCFSCVSGSLDPYTQHEQVPQDKRWMGYVCPMLVFAFLSRSIYKHVGS